MPGVAQAQQRSFDVPSQPANRAIPEFARQAGIQIIAPGSKLRKLRTRGIRGQLEIRSALKAMLEGTGIRILSDTSNTITLGIAAAPPRSAAPSRVRPPAVVGQRPAEPQSSARRRPVLTGTQPRDARSSAAAATQAPTPDILVTGSRIRTNGYDSPVPLTVVDAGLVENLVRTNSQDVVRLIPQNIATQSDATAANGFSVDIGAAFANLRGLNPTFGTRTLVLVNSRRFVPTSTGGQVDLNLIPSVMIGRVETVTGGASAAYGSDAVAGVVNIILDDKLQGFKGQVDYGQTGRGDGGSFHAAAAYGLGVAGGARPCHGRRRISAQPRHLALRRSARMVRGELRRLRQRGGHPAGHAQFDRERLRLQCPGLLRLWRAQLHHRPAFGDDLQFTLWRDPQLHRPGGYQHHRLLQHLSGDQPAARRGRQGLHAGRQGGRRL
ncbi:MAG: TonB-dependent receptor [Sphingomonas sp.]